MNAPPILMTTPTKALGELQTETITIEGVSFKIKRPVKSDLLLDDETVKHANRVDDYMPYWADIWPASRMLAKAILKRGDELLPTGILGAPVALELGCGLGLAGMAALKKGWHVVFSDYDTTALRFIEENARLNHFKNFETMPLDWRSPPTDRKFPVILGADLTYECIKHEALLNVIRQMLAPGGVALLTDPDRPSHLAFRDTLRESDFRWSMEFIRAGEPGGLRYKGTLYWLELP